MVYSRIVTKKVKETFDAINSGNYQVMLDGLADDFVYHFHGRHALGGHRNTLKSMDAWWQRVGRLLPGANFEIREVLVSGGPWRTRIAVNSKIRGDLPDGTLYENTVLQLMTLRWGKVAEVETLEDLQVLERALSVVAKHGQQEALAEPIEDPGPGSSAPQY
ncbi:nuclear transport factor 2 family protein [Kocuria soli]|uniref:Nuclear transport factor 2 family protein n=1 Tax=Kocuria soli TaxID=2485125 RepID=A0A3N4A644_9MICC|nr:nuclear transport factor 2 family protein [Kocuria soli]